MSRSSLLGRIGPEAEFDGMNDAGMWDRIKSAGLLVLVAVVALATGAAASQTSAQDVAPDPFPLRPPDTASPQDTLRSLRQNLLEAMQLWQAQEPGIAFRRARERGLRCLDLTELPPAVRVDYGSERAVLLLEILDRIELPPLEEIPDAAVVEATDLTSWTIPNTEITIARTAEGPYAGEFQVTAHTVERIPPSMNGSNTSQMGPVTSSVSTRT